MPEGPEVQLICDYLNDKLKGHKFVDHYIVDKRWLSKNKRFKEMWGSRPKRIGRVAKFLIWEWEHWFWVNHLAMTGGWVFRKDNVPIHAHTRARFSFDNGFVDFIDSRKWGKLDVLTTEEYAKQLKKFKKFGPDILRGELTIENLDEQIQKRVKRAKGRIEIKPLLMEQEFVAGLGNIYSAEILNLAGVNPFRDVRDLSDEEKAILVAGCKEFLKRAYEAGGSSIKDFVHPDGSTGRASRLHAVYNRKYCGQCKGPVMLTMQKQRSTYWCPKCQK